MSRNPCQCGSNCAELGCLDCCDCGAPIAGPVEKELRSRDWPSAIDAVTMVTTETWDVVTEAACSLGLDYVTEAWPDVLSEAIEAAEALGL